MFAAIRWVTFVHELSIGKRAGFDWTIFSRQACSGKLNYFQELLLVNMNHIILVNFREVVILNLRLTCFAEASEFTKVVLSLWVSKNTISILCGLYYFPPYLNRDKWSILAQTEQPDKSNWGKITQKAKQHESYNTYQFPNICPRL
jgi:hypothetical protein